MTNHKSYTVSSCMICFIICMGMSIPSSQAFQSSSAVPSTTTARTQQRPNSQVIPMMMETTASPSSWFAADAATNDKDDDDELTSEQQLKVQILQLGATLDRGQAYNPTSGSHYEESMNEAKKRIKSLVTRFPKPAKSLEDIDGEWELVFTTVKHGIFRSSPFFLAIQESYETYAEEKESFGEPKADLFFRLHELQTCSWGVSKIGRVAQTISAKDKYLYSEFDTSIFSLTVIPILGWFKLLPTFGGSVVTAAKIVDDIGGDGHDGTLKMEVDYTTSRKVPGLSGLPLIGDYIWKINVPVGFIWKLLPWNKGRPASCRVMNKYVDSDFRIVEDVSGDFFVYTRPVVPRPLQLNVAE